MIRTWGEYLIDSYIYKLVKLFSKYKENQNHVVGKELGN